MPNYFSAMTSSWSGREAQSDKRRIILSRTSVQHQKHQEGIGVSDPYSPTQLSLALKLEPPMPQASGLRLSKTTFTAHPAARPLGGPSGTAHKGTWVPSRSSELQAIDTPQAPAAAYRPHHLLAQADTHTRPPGVKTITGRCPLGRKELYTQNRQLQLQKPTDPEGSTTVIDQIYLLRKS